MIFVMEKKEFAISDLKNESKYLIKESADEEEIFDAVVLLESVHTPPISQMVETIRKYVRKLNCFGRVLLIENSERQTIGILAFYMNDRITHTAYVSLVLIAKKYQGMRLGKKLLVYMEKLAKDEGMKKVKLEVKKYNDIAIKFYENNGYKKMDLDIEDSYYMLKNL